MANWQETYDELAGVRYPELVAFADVLVGSRDAAVALVDSTLVAYLSHGKKFPEPQTAESELRRRVARAFVDGSPKDAEDTAAAPSHAAIVDAATYAPPTASAQGARVGKEAHHPVGPRASALEALDEVAPRTRAALVLRHHEGLPPSRIATALGMNADEVRSRLRAGGLHIARVAGIPVPTDDALDDAFGAVEVSVDDHRGERD